jgi:hypothetical protein
MADTEPVPQSAPDAKRAADSSGGGGARLVALLSLLVALGAIGVAAWALVMAWPQQKDTAHPSAAESKQKVCAAFDTVSRAVQLQTHADLGPDPIAQEAVAANARLSLVGGGEYLRSRLDDQTPPDLAEAVRLFANNLDDIGMNALAGATNEDPQQAARLTAGEDGRNKVADLCK